MMRAAGVRIDAAEAGPRPSRVVRCPPHLPALVGVDWGTSSFRARLAAADGGALDAGRGRDRQPSSLASGEHEAFLDAQIGGVDEAGSPTCRSSPAAWSARSRAGSRRPMSPPRGPAEIAAATIASPFRSSRRRPHRPRRERARRARRARRDARRGDANSRRACGGRRWTALFVLPGTHSKWARVEDGRIAGFETFMTGEVFAVLKDHSVLGRMMAPPREPARTSGFARGLEAAAGSSARAICCTRFS